MAKGGMNRKIMEMVVSTDSTEERNEEEKKQNEEYEKKYGTTSPETVLKPYAPQLPKIPNMNNVKL